MNFISIQQIRQLSANVAVTRRTWNVALDEGGEVLNLWVCHVRWFLHQGQVISHAVSREGWNENMIDLVLTYNRLKYAVSEMIYYFLFLSHFAIDNTEVDH